jgi:hypothetical protein
VGFVFSCFRGDLRSGFRTFVFSVRQVTHICLADCEVSAM